MSTWHQNNNPSAIQLLWAPHSKNWKCISDKPNQMASCIMFADRESAELYAKKTGDIVIAPHAKLGKTIELPKDFL